jgi:hypothetical protein
MNELLNAYPIVFHADSSSKIITIIMLHLNLVN